MLARLHLERTMYNIKILFLDFSGVFWWQINCSIFFPESSLLIQVEGKIIFPSDVLALASF